MGSILNRRYLDMTDSINYFAPIFRNNYGGFDLIAVALNVNEWYIYH
jgi:hypothetical protein